VIKNMIDDRAMKRVKRMAFKKYIGPFVLGGIIILSALLYSVVFRKTENPNNIKSNISNDIEFAVSRDNNEIIASVTASISAHTKLEADFDKVNLHQPLKAIFALYNDTNDVFNLSILKQSCGCMSVTVLPEEVVSGDCGFVTVKMEGKRGFFNEETYININKDKSKFITLNVRGYSNIGVELFKNRFDLGNIKQGDDIIVENILTAPQVDDFKILKIVSNDPNAVTTHVPSSLSGENERYSFHITYKSIADQWFSKNSSKVIIYYLSKEQEEKTIDFTVSLNPIALDSVISEPSVVSFGICSDIKKTKEIKLKTNENQKVIIDKCYFESSNESFFFDIKANNDENPIVLIGLKNPEYNQMQNDILIIETSSPSRQLVRIPCRVLMLKNI